MRKYLAQRLLIAVPTLFGVTLLIFIAMRVLPGDPLAAVSGEGGGMYVLNKEQLSAARASLGLDRPYVVQYLDWLRDVLRGDLGYLVTLGGPRGAEGVETFTFATPYFRFHRLKTVVTRGPTTMYLYALNTAGTAGSDTLLGVRQVTVRRASSMRASMVDRTIWRTIRPKVRVSLLPATVGGTVDIRRGSTRLATTTVTAGSSRVITLPRLKRGSHTLRVQYRGSSIYAGTSRWLTVTVR